MSDPSQPDPDDADRDRGASADTERVRELRAQLELLREENRRLRREHRRARRATHRRTAVGFVGLGLLALGAATAFPGSRDVLLALAGVGLFSGVLVYYLTPERFVAASVGERVYDAHRLTGEALVADLGLTDVGVYLPTSDGARLFVPQFDAFEAPAQDDLDGVVVVSGDERRRGIAVHPTGDGLAREFERVVVDDPASTPERLGEQLTDALVEAFELATSASVDRGESGRVTIGIEQPVYDNVDGFDHPIASLIGVAFARTLDRPVEVETVLADGDRVDVLITATWDAEAELSSGAESDANQR